MGSPYRVALVGTGGISRAHATACSQTDRAELVAVTDVSQESIDRFVRQFHVERMYLELDEMLANEAIDIAVICTWGVYHADVGIELATSKKVKAILCEKPFTQTADEAVRLVDSAESNGVLIAEAFKFRHHPMHLKTKEMIESGAIGDLLNLRSTFCTGGRGVSVSERLPEKNWRHSRERGGGAIYDLACYNIHHARWVFGGDPVRVFATQRPGLEVDAGANIDLEFSDGGVASLTVGFDAMNSQEFDIQGTEGAFRTDMAWNNENRPVWLDHAVAGSTHRFHINPVHQFTLQVEHLCDVLDGKIDHRISPQNSLGQMRTIDAIYESFNTKRAVEL
ncbi:Gfo/Idh/MocA family oxidoreductase [bacterium]|nr:Gfo/Idh/MocA family oxidoreductase [bacterium]